MSGLRVALLACMLSLGCKGSSIDCRALKEQFRQTLEQANKRCESNRDCTCSPGGVKGAGCGQIVDASTAAELTIAYEKISKYCELDFNCVPSECQAACRNGVCAAAPNAR